MRRVSEGWPIVARDNMWLSVVSQIRLGGRKGLFGRPRTYALSLIHAGFAVCPCCERSGSSAHTETHCFLAAYSYNQVEWTKGKSKCRRKHMTISHVFEISALARSYLRTALGCYSRDDFIRVNGLLRGTNKANAKRLFRSRLRCPVVDQSSPGASNS